MQAMPSVLVCPIAIDPTPTLVYHAACASIQDVATAEPDFTEGTHPIKQQRIMPWMACGVILYSFFATVTPQADAQEAAITVAAGTHVSIAYTFGLDEKTVLETNVGVGSIAMGRQGLTAWPVQSRNLRTDPTLAPYLERRQGCRGV